MEPKVQEVHKNSDDDEEEEEEEEESHILFIT